MAKRTAPPRTDAPTDPLEKAAPDPLELENDGAAVDDDAGEGDDVAVTVAECTPEANGNQSAPAFALLLEACERWNIDPRDATRPRELANWRYDAGNPREDKPAGVILVTAGGVKLRHNADGSADQDTEERLRQIFRAWQIDPTTKQQVPAPLPAVQSLPEAAVTGRPPSGPAAVNVTGRRHPAGYLRRGR